ncbi:MAG: hypothetical protein ABL955_10525, partial [Elusimicrobiota bacterium]
NAEDLIKSQMKDMDDMGKDMSSEIRRRAAGLPPAPRAGRDTGLIKVADETGQDAGAGEATNAGVDAPMEVVEEDAAAPMAPGAGAARMPPPMQRSAPSIPKPVVVAPVQPKPADKYINTPGPKNPGLVIKTPTPRTYKPELECPQSDRKPVADLKKKYEAPPNPNRPKGAETRQPKGERERNVGHQKGEEHSRLPKGPKGPKK